MIKMVASGELQDPSTFSSSRPQTSESQVRYIWYPAKSQPKKANKNQVINEQEELRFPSLMKKDDRSQVEGGLCEMEKLPQNFPKNDSIIRTALNLSRQASRDRSRAGPGMLGHASKEIGMEQLVKRWQGESAEVKKHPHRRSASLNIPTSSGHIRSTLARSSALQRVKSLTTPTGGRVNDKVQLPPPPVKVHITKETLHPGSSGSARLRYTSHWNK